MKKFGIVALMVTALTIPGLLLAQVETDTGSMQIGAKIKWLYIYQGRDKEATGTPNYWDETGNPVEDFNTSSIELGLMGDLGEKVSYLLELQAKNNNEKWQSSPHDMRIDVGGDEDGSAIGIRQAKIMVSDLIPMTTVTLGTFNLPVSNYQQRATNDWDLINLPLLNSKRFGGRHDVKDGGLYSVYGLGWQATGVNFGVQPMDMLHIDFAYHNGYAGGQPNQDVDLGKSMMLNISVAPMDALDVSLAWMNDAFTEPGIGNVIVSGWVLSGSYITEKIDATFDWTQSVADEYDDLTWTGYQLTFGYWFTDSMEGLIRYENIDPNTDQDNDQLTWTTLGYNYRLNENAEVAVNYVLRDEEGDQVDRTKGDIGGYGNDWKYNKIDNDLFLIQVQLWQ